MSDLAAQLLATVTPYLGRAADLETRFDGPNLNERTDALIACEERFGVSLTRGVDQVKTVADLAALVRLRLEASP